MRYTAFSFRNFKGIGQMSLHLDGEVTTLIGLNESGKTTILEAIFCFTYGAENLDVLDPNMASLRDPERWIPISLRANFNDTISISASVELSELDQKGLRKHMLTQAGLHLSAVPKSLTITENYIFENSRHSRSSKTWSLSISGTKGRQRKPRGFSGDTPEWQTAVAFLKTQLPSIWYFPNFLFELPERFVLNAAGAEVSSEEQDKSAFYRSTFVQILDQLGYGANLDTHVVERLQSDDRADQRSLRSILLDMGRIITKTVFEGWNRIFGRPPAAQEVELEADTGEDGTAFLELKIKGPDGYYDLSERSLGFRWFFMFLLMTTYRRSSDNGRPAMFLLDEPASNLHSSAQAELLKSFENLAKSCHLVYTTHSHHLINLRWLDNAYVVKNEALDGFSLEDYFSERVAVRTSISATKYRKFVASHPDQTSYFQPVLDLLDYRPSALEPVPAVVLVEGKTDFYLLKYLTEVAKLESTLRLVPGGGAGSLDSLIRLHIGWGKTFLILLDGDAEGRKQKTRYEAVFGPLVTDRCLLLPEILGDSGVKEAEDILSEADRVAIIESIFPRESERPRRKKALGMSIVELYARRMSVPLSEMTIARFTHLLGSLSTYLDQQDP